jgi:hypothetical protein
MILHRYFRTTDGLLSLQNLELKVAIPSEFNDPFELCPVDITKWTYSNVDNYYKKDQKVIERFSIYADKLNQPLSNIWKIAIEEVVKKSHNGYAEKAFEDMRKFSDTFLRFICFSSSQNTSEQNQILMWSHYADKHRGLRIHFDSTKFSESETQIKSVKYGERVPFNILLDKYSEEFKTQMQEVLLKKSEAWQYEDEYRMIIDQNCCKEKNKLWFYKIYPKVLFVSILE